MAQPARAWSRATSSTPRRACSRSRRPARSSWARRPSGPRASPSRSRRPASSCSRARSRPCRRGGRSGSSPSAAAAAATTGSRPPFVGRDTELRLLKDLFHATSRERRVRLVSVTGQGGIGKSRLAWEFQKYLDGLVEPIWWHEGRSPVVRRGDHVLVAGRDGPCTRAPARDGRSGRRRARASARCSRSTCPTRRSGAGSSRRCSRCSGWRRPGRRAGASCSPPGARSSSGSRRRASSCCCSRTSSGRTRGLLDFIEHVLEWTRNVPILIVTLARPELLEQRPEWGAGKRASWPSTCEPLDDAAMRELLAGLVAGPARGGRRARSSRAPRASRCTRSRPSGCSSPTAGCASGRTAGYEPVGELGELAVPDTLHALIAARLDGLDAAERALVQDAAVLGQSVHDRRRRGGRRPRSRGGDRAGSTASSGRELLRREVDPRSPERGQYAFVQALIREVAYSTLALRDRRSAPPRGRPVLRVDRRRRARRRPRRPLSRRLPRVHRGSRGRGARRPGADRAPRRGRACDRARRARPGRRRSSTARSR